MNVLSPFISRMRQYFCPQQYDLPDNNMETGQKGEHLAAEYLRKKGFMIRERNYETPFGEIDIIAYRKKHLYFIEVKTLKQKGVEDARFNLTREKLKHNFRSGMYYVKKYEIQYTYSFAAIIINLFPYTIDWYDNISLDCDAENIIHKSKRGKL